MEIDREALISQTVLEMGYQRGQDGAVRCLRAAIVFKELGLFEQEARSLVLAFQLLDEKIEKLGNKMLMCIEEPGYLKTLEYQRIEEIRHLIKCGEKLTAIKAYRDLKRCPFTEAKAWVDAQV